MSYYFAKRINNNDLVSGSGNGTYLYYSLKSMRKAFKARQRSGYLPNEDSFEIYKMNTNTMTIEHVGSGPHLMSGYLELMEAQE